MGRYNLTPARVYQKATRLLESGSIQKFANGPSHPPPWYTTIGSVPPGEILTRVAPVQHQDTTTKRRSKKPSKMFMPQAITYEEDSLRQHFYSDHPWELARPRIIVEQDGKDGQKCDWSKIQQTGRQLNAESVVQRQVWLLHNVEDMTSTKAYDIARGEFYALRHEEDVERRVAKEEALSTGAYFGKSVLEVGMELEDKVHEEWKEWAKKEVEVLEQQQNATYTSFDEEDNTTTGPVADPDLAEFEPTGTPIVPVL